MMVPILPKGTAPMIDPEKYRKAAYLKAADLPGRRTRVCIHSVGEQQIGTPSELKLVLQFTSDKVKPMVCNYTNTVTLVDAFGPDEQTWIGKIIILLKTKAMFQGKNVDAIRVEFPPQPVTPDPAPTPVAPPPPPAPAPIEADATLVDEADLV
jgi:hypothetical protein